MEQIIFEQICHPIYLALDYIESWHYTAVCSTQKTNCVVELDRHMWWLQTGDGTATEFQVKIRPNIRETLNFYVLCVSLSLGENYWTRQKQNACHPLRYL